MQRFSLCVLKIALVIIGKLLVIERNNTLIPILLHNLFSNELNSLNAQNILEIQLM